MFNWKTGIVEENPKNQNVMFKVNHIIKNITAIASVRFYSHVMRDFNSKDFWRITRRSILLCSHCNQFKIAGSNQLNERSSFEMLIV
jgi:hypothetical protein